MNVKCTELTLVLLAALRLKQYYCNAVFEYFKLLPTNSMTK